MSAPLLLIHGTWGRDSEWFRADSPFIKGAIRRGFEIFDAEPWLWSGRLEVAKNDEWVNEGRHLTYYCAALHPDVEVSIIAHSHGGQLAALAIARGGLRVKHLVTVATPIRKDMEEFYRAIPTRISGTWLHIYGDWWKDWMQKLGEFGDGYLGWYRKMPHAANIHAKGTNHSSTLQDDGAWFERLGVWGKLL